MGFRGRASHEFQSQGPERSGAGLEIEGLNDARQGLGDSTDVLVALGRVIECGGGRALELKRPEEMRQRLARPPRRKSVDHGYGPLTADRSDVISNHPSLTV
jgi:hypothetical protein